MTSIQELANTVQDILAEVGSRKGAGAVITAAPALNTDAEIMDYIKGAKSPYRYMELALYKLARIDTKVSPGVVAAGAAAASDLTGYDAAVTLLATPATGILGTMGITAGKAQLIILLPALTTDNDAQLAVIRYLQSLSTEADITALFDTLKGPSAPVVVGGKRRKSRKARKSRRSRRPRRSRRSRRSRRARRARMMV